MVLSWDKLTFFKFESQKSERIKSTWRQQYYNERMRAAQECSGLSWLNPLYLKAFGYPKLEFDVSYCLFQSIQTIKVRYKSWYNSLN